MFILYLIVLLIAILVLAAAGQIYRKQWHNLVRPRIVQAEFTGIPNYIAGSTSGSPLSELGSYCGFKAVPEREAVACNALFATITSFGAGRLYDFAAGLYTDDGHEYFVHPEFRKVHFSPYCIEEQARDRNFDLHSRLFFLQRNLAVLETTWEAIDEEATVRPFFYLLSIGGRDLENPYPHFNGFTFLKAEGRGLQLSNHHRLPGQKLYAYFLPSDGSSLGNKELHGLRLKLCPGQKKSWSVVISFSADSAESTIQRAERALRNLEKLKTAAEKRWLRFDNMLPVPCDAENEEVKTMLNLAAWGLQNNLYYPRAKMQRWGSVPSKVYFPFIWGWDTPQHVLGLSEWNPDKAADILLTQLEGNDWAPRYPRFRVKVKGITIYSGSQRNQIPSKINDSLRGVLNFYSQPPLQSWAAVRVYERFQETGKKEQFLQQVLPSLRENLCWWEENRLLADGFFSFINGLESGLDDSPRFYPPSFLPSFIVGLIPRFFSALDLNCWLFQSYLNIAYLSREAGLEDEAAQYLARSSELKERIDEELWSSKHEAWLDRRNGKFIEVLTPAIWWPAFVGATSNLERVRTVIEKYLLQPDKFWGEHGIPSVAFDDDFYNRRKDGYYWRGQIWMINNYAALEVLFRFGYAEEARELHRRVMQTLTGTEGLYETYNAETGAIGWSSRGPGDPAVMQFGMSSAWATQIILCRYQHFCYIFPETTELCGQIQWATTFDQAPRLSPPSVETAPEGATLQVCAPETHSYDLPRLSMQSRDGKPLLESGLIMISFEDPVNYPGHDCPICFTWQGEKYRVQADKNYLLRPFAQSDKLTGYSSRGNPSGG